MFRTIKDFQRIWQYESEMTLKMLNAFTDESLGQKVTEDGRDMGFLAWHLSQTIGEMLGLVGLTVDAPAHDLARPSSASDIAAAYERACASAAKEIESNWTDETLTQTDEMYGETWARGFTLFCMVTHQSHHRGQITVLMRQAGLVVPGVYGPAKEEWAAMGAPAMP